MTANARKLLTAMVTAVLVSPAFGQSPGQWLNPRLGASKTSFEFTYRGYFEQDVKKQREDLDASNYILGFSTPIRQNDTSEWSAFGRLGVWDINTDGMLAGDKFSDHLYDIELGTAYRWKTADNWLWGVSLAVGSPSDKPFSSGEEISVAANAFLRIPDGERNAWVFMANLSNTREFLPYVPIPGVAYWWEVNDDLDLLLGVPFSSVRWTPLEKLSVEASYRMLRNVHAKVSYEILDGWWVYGSFDWDNQRFFRHDRPDDDDRLWYYEKRVAGGLRVKIMEDLHLDFSGGYAFDRIWFESDEYSDRGDDIIHLGDGPFVGVSLNWRF